MTIPVGESSGLRVDLHNGSYMQSAGSGPGGILGMGSAVYRDVAVRRGFIDSQHLGGDTINHTQLLFAIIAAKNPVLHKFHTGTGEYIHPFFDPALPLASVRVWKWGPHAYFELKYRLTRETNLPVPAAIGMTWATSYDHAKSFRLYREGVGGFAQFEEGLPAGDINFPDQAAGSSDPDNRPIGNVYKRVTNKLVVKTILDEHPYITNEFIPSAANTINDTVFDKFGNVETGFNLLPTTVRFDGATVNTIGLSKFAVTYNFTYISFGHLHQEPYWNGSNWVVVNTISHQRLPWADNFFPVAW